MISTAQVVSSKYVYSKFVLKLRLKGFVKKYLIITDMKYNSTWSHLTLVNGMRQPFHGLIFSEKIITGRKKTLISFCFFFDNTPT